MNNFKILSIDGGGIKGLYSARILQHFEEALQKKHNDPNLRIVDFFDLLCGTSTGGLIALGISLRVPMHEICDFYEKKGAFIFPKSIGFWKTLKQTFLRGKYSDKALKAALVEMFQERTLGESQALLCIPSFDFTNGTYALFKYDHKEGNLSRHNKLKYVDVALATSAAPTFFPMAQIAEENETQYVDGGVWANNPAMIGFAEAMRYFVGEGKAYEKVQILSVASLNPKAGKKPMMRRQKGFIGWAKDLFDLSLIGQSEFCDIFLESLTKNTTLPLEYVRIPSAIIAGEQVNYIALDKAEKRSMVLMKQFADDMYHRNKNIPAIVEMLKERKTYRTDV